MPDRSKSQRGEAGIFSSRDAAPKSAARQSPQSATRVSISSAVLTFARLVEFAAGQILEFREMIGPQRFADPVVLTEPLPEIDHLAARGAEGAEWFGEEI